MNISKITLDVQEMKFNNGLKLLLLEDHNAPIVTFQIWYKVGSRNERPGITGISHLFEHMMFKGSQKIGPEEHSRKINAIGGRENAFTLWDVTTYYEVIPSEHLELAIFLESERLQNLNLVPQTLQSEREVVKEERRLRTDNDPVGLALEQLFAMAFMAHSYHWPIVGWMSDLDAITLNDCKEYYATYYAPNNATIIVVGDFKKKQALSMLKKYFGSIKNEAIPPEVTTKEPGQKGIRRGDVKVIAEAPIILAGFKTPPAADKDNYVLKVASSLLSNGESSRIYKSLIYDKQLAAEAGGEIFALKDYGLYFAYALVNPDAYIDEVEKYLINECERLKSDTIPEEELQKAKNQLEADYIFDLASVYGKAIQLGTAEIIYGNWQKVQEMPEKLQQVTANDIKKIAQKYFNKELLTVIRVIPEN
ncbi:MAG: hypothetical protein A2Y62_06820 [Candidatus Fischerbacteria bacterium RBG_13_37_8]|uniref:Peptidase M16 n=1 Tax=Candidatus Fischerbacteria bacterium RBG_13_37_8 TaxID=1817863 RepID=A0A1F5VM86_9BACT|nr:MAG: hypothetical protein A2Y62_06820 [Candidatus Fischerbacteria bacterium RBG_13_37_8]